MSDIKPSRDVISIYDDSGIIIEKEISKVHLDRLFNGEILNLIDMNSGKEFDIKQSKCDDDLMELFKGKSYQEIFSAICAARHCYDGSEPFLKCLEGVLYNV